MLAWATRGECSANREGTPRSFAAAGAEMASTRTEGVIVVLVIVLNAVLSAILMIALLALIWRVGRGPRHGHALDHQ